jgi:hypothetical protein
MMRGCPKRTILWEVFKGFCGRGNIAGHAAPQKLAAIVYLGEGALALAAIAAGSFVGHSKHITSSKKYVQPLWRFCHQSELPK